MMNVHIPLTELLGMRSENLLNKFHPVYDTSLLMGIPTQICRKVIQ